MSSSCVYILYSKKLDKYYIGSTEDLALRLHIHNHPHEDRKFTAKGLPWVLKCSIDCRDKPSALALERRIKSMKSRKFIERLLSEELFRTEFCQSFASDC
ncbi:MAG: GIY-YIG nuclease family protein [Cytophagia bacterium]|nr:GIY-YIG nuclease family protein [Cytophagia bacterium]